MQINAGLSIKRDPWQGHYKELCGNFAEDLKYSSISYALP